MSTITWADIEARDAKHLGIYERALLVNDFIEGLLGTNLYENPYNWDIFCWSCVMFTIFAQFLGREDSLKLASEINRFVQLVHYSFPDSHPALGPSREEHTRIWTNLTRR
jgi:hypothetical protein